MHTERLQPEDLPFIQEWWESRGFSLPAEVLPKIGLCAWDHDDLIAAGWLFTSDSAELKLGWMTWICSNPEYIKRASSGLRVLVRGLSEEAKKDGVSFLIGSHNSRMLDAVYADLGFTLGHDGVKQFITKL